jgi:hypothetical protein
MQLALKATLRVELLWYRKSGVGSSCFAVCRQVKRRLMLLQEKQQER